ncbi:MAG TPA: hypothetical protein VM935_20395 [Chitinophagaceae bacterium]|nr:hypothetical protein [Chitinophagaceae bacterium]
MQPSTQVKQFNKDLSIKYGDVLQVRFLQVVYTSVESPGPAGCFGSGQLPTPPCKGCVMKYVN